MILIIVLICLAWMIGVAYHFAWKQRDWQHQWEVNPDLKRHKHG